MGIKVRFDARAVTGVVAALSLALTAASCGGDDDDDASSTAPAATAAPSASGDATAPSQAPGSTTGSSDGAAAEIAAAQAALEPHLSLPTAIPQTEPLSAPPEPGKTLVWTECDAPQCAISTKFFKEATEAIGWNLEVVNYDTADPATLIAAMQQALQYDPVATMLVAQPYAVWSSVVPDYEKAGVAILPWSTGEVGESTAIPTIVLDDSDYAAPGIALANWFIVDSGAAANVLVWNVSQLPSIDGTAQAMRETIEAGCSACEVTMLDAPYADVASGKAVPAIVSALQRDSSITYVLSAEAALTTALSGQLEAVGISGIKIAGHSVEEADETLIKAGKESAGVPGASNIINYLMVDAALRIAEGNPIPVVHNQYPVLTTDLDFVPSDTFEYPADWQEQFLQLWQVE